MWAAGSLCRSSVLLRFRLLLLSGLSEEAREAEMEGAGETELLPTSVPESEENRIISDAEAFRPAERSGVDAHEKSRSNQPCALSPLVTNA